jgi:hypothetical protein
MTAETTSRLSKSSQSSERPRPVEWLAHAAGVFVMCLREIFDEAPYGRFLGRVQKESSPEAYAAFRRDNEIAKARRPRCC